MNSASTIGSPYFFTEKMPIDIQRNISNYVTYQDISNLAGMNKFNQDRLYQMAVRYDFLTSCAMNLCPTFLQTFLKPTAEVFEKWIGPKRIANNFVDSLKEHALPLTPEGRAFLKQHHLDSFLIMQRLAQGTSTVKIESEKRDEARKMINEAIKVNKFQNYRCSYMENNEDAVTLLADGLMSIDELTRFVNSVQIPSNLPFFFKTFHGLLAKNIISVEQLLTLAHTLLDMETLCAKSIQNALIKGILTVDQIDNLTLMQLYALDESEFKLEIIELGLREEQEGFKLKLNSYTKIKREYDLFDFSEDALQSFKEIKTYEDIKKRATELWEARHKKNAWDHDAL